MKEIKKEKNVEINQKKKNLNRKKKKGNQKCAFERANYPSKTLAKKKKRNWNINK